MNGKVQHRYIFKNWKAILELGKMLSTLQIYGQDGFPLSKSSITSISLRAVIFCTYPGITYTYQVTNPCNEDDGCMKFGENKCTLQLKKKQFPER